MASENEVRAALNAYIDGRAHEKAVKMTADAIANMAGNQEIWLGAGAPGGVILASATNPQMHGYTVHPCQIDEAHLSGAPTAGSAVLDVRVARPGQAISAANSIFAGTYPTLAAAREGHYILADVKANGWTLFIEAGSYVEFLVRSVSGFDTVQITLGARLF